MNKIIMGLIVVLSITAISIGTYIVLRERSNVTLPQQSATPTSPPSSGTSDQRLGQENALDSTEGTGTPPVETTLSTSMPAETKSTAGANVSSSESSVGSSPGKLPASPDAPSNSTPTQDTEQHNLEQAVTLANFHKADSLWIQLASARVDFVEMKSSIGGSTSQSAEKYLICTFLVRNTNDRKIVSYNEGRIGASQFSMRDDVDNNIRGVRLGVSDEIVGAISSGHDLQPGEEATVIKVFRIPPPKTKHLIISVDLAAFSKSGHAKFTLESGEIQDFPTSQSEKSE